MTDAPLNWADLGNTKVGEVEPPAKLPVGHYGAVVTGAPTVENRGKKNTLCCDFPIKMTQPLDDVDAEELQEAGGIPDKEQRLVFWLTPNSLFMFTDFGKALGASDDLSVVEMAEFIQNSGEEFVVEYKLEQGDNGRQYSRIENPMAMSAYNA